MEKELLDTFGRKHDYLRISLTDKCNFRCTYCMPSELMKFMPDHKLMSADEIFQLASIFKEFGIKKIRLTGGEPTLRKDLVEIIAALSTLNLSLSITTNAFLLDELLDDFEKYNLRNINISIDSLKPEKFSEITKRNSLDKVMNNIKKACERGFYVKLNAVIIKDVNDDEITDIIEWASTLKVNARFLEYMPFFKNNWEYSKVFSKEEILNCIAKKYEFNKKESAHDSTSVNYSIPSLGAEFGIIPTVTQAFCNGCSRIRLTSDGKIKNCLFSNDESDLLTALRNGEDVKELIRENIFRKKKAAAGKINFKDENAKIEYAKNRTMVSIGG